MKKIAIVGSGPAGGQSAYHLAREGFDVHIFEKQPREKVGTPVQCTGIVSKNFKEFFTDEEMNNFTLNTINGAHIYSKNECLSIKTEQIQAYIICRIKFDNFLLNRAEKSGAKVYTGHYLKGLSRLSDGRYKLIFDNQGKEVNDTFDIVIGADGPHSKVAKLNKMYGKREFWYGAQAVVKGNFEKDMVMLYVGDDYPGFFAWFVPESNTYGRIGVAAEKNSRELFEKIMKKLSLPNSSIKEMQGGVIPKFKPIKTQKDNVYLIGDAAMMTKQTTGGGIVMSLIAADCLRQALCEGKSYDKVWKKKIQRDLKMSRNIRWFLDKLNDKKYDNLISRVNKNNKNTLEQIGDMDFPSRFMTRILVKDPLLVTVFF